MKNAIKVLIVDDDRSSAQALSESIERLGYKAIVANKPADALNIVKLQTVHVAIVDVLLPKTSGIDLAVEFRDTKFRENPIVFVSGVFKDKNFASTALKKTNAVKFLFKPYGVDELAECMKNIVQEHFPEEKWTLQSLLTRKFVSQRERLKAVERLEELKGPDFLFLLSFLMSGGVSGTINIVNDQTEVFSARLMEGHLTALDNPESEGSTILNLISQGFLQQDDWDRFQFERPKNFSLESLVAEGYVSPHAVSLARKAQIQSDIGKISSAAQLQVNFVPDEVGGPIPIHALSQKHLIKVLIKSFEPVFGRDYLVDFYKSLTALPISTIEGAEALLDLPLFDGLEKFKDSVVAGVSLQHLIPGQEKDPTKLLRGVHFLVLSGALTFHDLSEERRNRELIDRYKQMHEELKSRTADKIFTYFGASENLAPETIQKIYDTFVASNGPQLLGPKAPPEAVELCRSCVKLVTDARDTLLDEERRKKLFEDLESEAVKQQTEASRLVADGLNLLRTGQPARAVQVLKQAGQLHSSSRQFYVLIWAEMKAGTYGGKDRLFEILKKLDQATGDDRKMGYYWMALGLVKKALGDQTAQSCFEKAIQHDSLLQEARREINQMNMSAMHEKTGKSILTTDVSQIITSFFKRKAD